MIDFIPRTRWEEMTSDSGHQKLVIFRSWFGRKKIVKVCEIGRRFWPDDESVAARLTPGFSLKNQPKPTMAESAEAVDLIASRGYKVIRRFWNWQSVKLARRCCYDSDETLKSQGMYEGFQLAKTIIEQVANWSEEEAPMTFDQADFYLNMSRMDSQAVQEY